MPDEDRVFDVTKPGDVSPSATSRPVIVGHQPMMSDPMVSGSNDMPPPTRIQVNDGSSMEDSTLSIPEPSSFDVTQPPLTDTEYPDSSPPNTPGVFSGPSSPKEHNVPPATSPIESLHVAQPKRQHKGLKILILLILALLIAGYLAIDSGLIRGASHLPFHVFKQTPKATTSTPPAASSNTSTTPSLPDGFKEYKLAGTPITFAAPTTWGDPTSTTDPGFSMRGGTNQSDGTYAYLVSFATNKDVQIAVTSSKYLPPARAALYYDYLQWCTGTNDGKIYESILHFSTANKVDTPTTITCDQGPIVSAVKLDSSTILQAKAQDTTNKVVGDIYTKNLTDPSLVVLRVKDAAMTNGDNIKQLLNTIQVTSASQ